MSSRMTVSVDLPSDDMKGRMMAGRKPQKYSCSEMATGVDIIIDDMDLRLSSFSHPCFDLQGRRVS